MIFMIAIFAVVVVFLFVFGFKAIAAEKRRVDRTERRTIEIENIMNGLDVMIYVTDPNTNKILFMNDCMKQHYNINGDCVGLLCYKILQKDFDKRCDFCPCFKLDKDPDKSIIWEEHSTLTNRIYRNVDRYIQWPNKKTVHMQYSVDMTELIAAKEFAEQTSRYKSAFLANMSHEIRTPMNTILGIAEIQLRDEMLSLETENALSKIYEAGDLLLNIINDILDLSKIEAGKLELIPVKYDIPSLINDIAQLNRLRYESNPIEFTLNVDENLPYELFGDELRIKQVLCNILSNAFKYTSEGSVELSVTSESKHDDTVMLIFRVSDTGQGMSEDQVEKLFNEYARFNIDTNRTTVGTGLGMSITKRLLDLMNGEILVESEQDKGSAFTVRIPQKRIGLEVCGAELAGKLHNFCFQNTTIMKKAQFLREYMPYGSVLVVDDVDSNIFVTKGMLRPYGLNIDTVSSGFEAIEKIKNGNVYDIVFMDHMMPKMDGITAVKIIRDMGYTHTIIALTANALIGRAQMFMQKGFNGFISKPIDSRELNFLLNEFIRNKKPPEVVEAARQEQHKKEQDNKDTFAKKEARTFEKKKLFIRDAENTVNVLENIKTANDSDMELYIVTVHGMKSVLANIGEKMLSGMALKLEQACAERNLVVIQNETPVFVNALRSLIAKYKPDVQVLAEQDGNLESATGDTAYLHEKLLSIKAACETLNKNAAKTALEELKQETWTKETSIILDDIALHILHSAFKKAAALVDSVI
jgi:signal transduction histidine kinase/CheY-like chemotaxis protein